MVWISVGIQGSRREYCGQAPDGQSETFTLGVHGQQQTDPHPPAVLVIVPPGLKKVEYFLFYKPQHSNESTRCFPRWPSFLCSMRLLALSPEGRTDSALCPGQPGGMEPSILP